MQRRLGLGVFLFSNIMLVEFDCNMVSSFAMTSESKSNCFLFRILNNIIFYIVLPVVFLIYLKLFKIDAQYEYRSEYISYAILLISGVINTILFSLISIAVSNITKNDILGMLAASGYWLFWFIVYGKEGFKTCLLNPFSIILKYIYNFLLKWCNKLYNKYKIYLLYNLLHHLLLNFFKK
ncbi:hypothetical protein [Paraclostridium bifermentans]|uniref:hypothetical protein n=1 Tax=Paraclostridium bifermentans TaxID=1490 RepID=UPI0029123076|nr:hypothetical protein [Paraclostridium bifermentans]MDU3338073.1 hypothetical protein [Paraclostridium bifermentans]